MIKKIPIISNAGRNEVQKRGLQARGINGLHCICVSGYYHHHHHHYHYHYYHYYCISTQATSIIKRALIGLACVAWAGNYLTTGRARGTREGERRPPLLFSPHASSTFLLSPLLPPSAQEQAPTQVQWHDAELTVKWHLTDRLLSPMRMYCVLGYWLLEPHWSPTQRSIFAHCIAAQKQAELY